MDRFLFVTCVALSAIWFVVFKVIHRVRVDIYESKSHKGEDVKVPLSEDSFGLSFVIILILIPFFSPYW